MPTVADVLRRYGGQYLERFGTTMPREHKKVLHAITACRTGELGTVLYACQSCGEIHAIGRSCGNRHCPTCQHGKTKAWLDKQTDRLLPCPYFLVTFTLPAELRALARSHQRVIYAALFEASSQALRALAANPRFVGTYRLGFFGVLHTWGRTLDYHPHVHYVVPGGGIDEDGSRWLPSRANFLVPEEALSILFRGKFRGILARENLLHLVDPAVWRRHWVVDSQAAGDSSASLRYLAPYVFRVAIGNHRIVSCENGNVTFTYRRVGSQTAEDVTGRDGIPPPLPPARPARRVPEGTALRIPEPQLCDINRGGAMDGDGAQPGKVRAAGGADRRTCRTAGAAMPLVRRPDGPPGIRAGPGTIRYELTR